MTSRGIQQGHRNLIFTTIMPSFVDWEMPQGFLPSDVAAKALMYYAMVASKNHFEFVEHTPLVLEGTPDSTTNFRQLFESIAMAYDVPPPAMVRYWKEVDMQFFALGWTRLPDEERYRFNRPIEVK